MCVVTITTESIINGKVELKNEKFRFGFKYVKYIGSTDDTKENKVKNKVKIAVYGGKALSNIGDDRIDTVCYVEKLIAENNVDGKPLWSQVSSGATTRNPKDPFSKTLGRTIAIRRALKSLDRKVRLAIYNKFTENFKYVKETGHPKIVKVVVK